MREILIIEPLQKKKKNIFIINFNFSSVFVVEREKSRE